MSIVEHQRCRFPACRDAAWALPVRALAASGAVDGPPAATEHGHTPPMVDRWSASYDAPEDAPDRRRIIRALTFVRAAPGRTAAPARWRGWSPSSASSSSRPASSTATRRWTCRHAQTGTPAVSDTLKVDNADSGRAAGFGDPGGKQRTQGQVMAREAENGSATDDEAGATRCGELGDAATGPGR